MVNEGTGYDVFVRTVIKNHLRKPVKDVWTVRTNGHCQTDLEMARALTQDLTRMKVAWQIRNSKGEVIEKSEVTL